MPGRTVESVPFPMTEFETYLVGYVDEDAPIPYVLTDEAMDVLGLAEDVGL